MSYHIPDDLEAARRAAYDEGLTDDEIAAKTGAKSRQVIHEWRKRRGLPAHRERGRPRRERRGMQEISGR